MSKRHSNHNRPITIGDRSPKDDKWLDEEIAKIRLQRIAQRGKRKTQEAKTPRQKTP